MNKIAIIAALFGVVACVDDPDLPGFNYDAALPENNYFNFGFRFATDAGYRSTYEVAEGDENHDEIYGFEIYSFANVTLSMEYFKTYKNSYTFSFIPFDVYPYKQHVTYNNPESGEGNEVRSSGTYEIHLLKFETTVRENTKTCRSSFINAVDEGAAELKPTCDYDATKESQYVDPFWKYDVPVLVDLQGAKDIWGAKIFGF